LILRPLGKRRGGGPAARPIEVGADRRRRRTNGRTMTKRPERLQALNPPFRRRGQKFARPAAHLARPGSEVLEISAPATPEAFFVRVRPKLAPEIVQGAGLVIERHAREDDAIKAEHFVRGLRGIERRRSAPLLPDDVPRIDATTQA